MTNVGIGSPTVGATRIAGARRWTRSIAGALVLILATTAVLVGCTAATTVRSTTAESTISVAAVSAQLAALEVLPTRPNIPGYQRGCGAGQGCVFGSAWTDDNNDRLGHNGCGSRDDVLAAQLRNVSYRAGSRCVVVSGILTDPYTGRTITFRKADADAVQIDHLVPLALAWDLGANAWPLSKRIDYANDTDTVLLAVDGSANQSKSDSGPGGWMPPTHGEWCDYVARFVAVLAKYQLPITRADKAAIDGVLPNC